jgi:hypothetical protein
MGRVMRSHEGKEFALWLDHSGNYLRFREDWEDVFENGINSLDEGRERAKTEPTKAEKEAAKCPKCSHIWPSGSDTCPSCGHVRERRNDVTAVPGVMEELGGASAAREMQRNWYAQLLGHSINRGYAKGWAYHKYVEKFGAEPKFRSVSPIEPNPEVARWITASYIKWAKSKKRAA